MPIILQSQQDFRAVRRLPFCYLCTESFKGSDTVSDDHVPPTTLFLRGDRTPPVILATHAKCNNDQSQDDQAVGQLAGLLHGTATNPQHLKLTYYAGRADDGSPLAAASGLDLRRVIRRWVRGFHAALYAEPLPESGRFATNPPLPEADIGAGPSPGTFVLAKIDVQAVIPRLAPLISTARARGQVDTVLSRNGMCRYDCVWTLADDGKRFCAYELKVYDWVALGDTAHFEPCRCVGLYTRPDFETPARATLLRD
jgi:hypothetical protein